VELADLAAHDGHLTEGPSVSDAPDGVEPLSELRVDAGDEILTGGPAPPDHRVHVVAPGGASRGDVHLLTETTLVREENESTDVATDVKDKSVRRTGPGPGVFERLFADTGAHFPASVQMLSAVWMLSAVQMCCSHGYFESAVASGVVAGLSYPSWGSARYGKLDW
jgi:hypothetical protein